MELLLVVIVALLGVATTVALHNIGFGDQGRCEHPTACVLVEGPQIYWLRGPS